MREANSGSRARVVLLALVLAVAGCATLRGRADDALARGDYRSAVQLYGQLLAREPNNAGVKSQLTKAERGLLDQMLDRAEAARRSGDPAAGLKAALEAVETKDLVHAEALDGTRPARVTATIDWAAGTLRASIHGEATRGRALVARAQHVSAAAWFKRPELASLGPELDAEIAAAGARTCARGTQTAGEQPFALELVAAYCKQVGGPLPAWKARPLLVGGLTLAGGISGTPANENVEVERVVTEALERSVWFTATTNARATAQLQGAVSATFTKEPIELSRPWTESVPYEANEVYSEAVQVPYIDIETYSESIPYTAYEDRLETCPPPRKGLCNVPHPVTRYRSESRTRRVKRFRTEYRERTRVVTRYRDEPRVFTYPATRHEGRYQATFFVRVDLGSGLRPIEARSWAEDAQVAHDHDAEFAPAGVHPERATLPSGMSWRQQQRDRLRDELLRSLDEGWNRAFCNEAIGSIEEAARCARGRPRPVPQAVRVKIEELFGDDPDRVLALPRPGEAIH